MTNPKDVVDAEVIDDEETTPSPRVAEGVDPDAEVIDAEMVDW